MSGFNINSNEEEVISQQLLNVEEIICSIHCCTSQDNAGSVCEVHYWLHLYTHILHKILQARLQLPVALTAAVSIL